MRSPSKGKATPCGGPATPTEGRSCGRATVCARALESHRALAEELRVEVASLRLVDQRFYHLDTCFVPLPHGRVMYYPPAFDEPSRQLIESLAPADRRIEVGDEDAHRFACNAVRLGNTLFTSHSSDELRRALAAWDFEVVTTPLTEFIKAGGAAKCLTLVLDQDLPDGFERRPPVESPIRSASVEMEGHLLDEGVMTHAFDTVNRAGSGFRLERLRAGERSDQTSRVRFVVSVPSQSRLDETVERLRPFGARIAEEGDVAALVVVQQDGVAPEDFCCSTIYPTDIRVGERWVRVGRQRMDAAIVVDDSCDPPTARCELMRNLHAGEAVVCGETGVRVHIPDPRRGRREFAFMSSEVTTERRVEGQIDELALEMRRIRARGDRIAVVAGPVVIHTGAGRHLEALIRAGYVQALLSGNALAVHDIETNLFGTSLGVDLNRGTGVQGGHRHHLNAINRVRAARLHRGGSAQRHRHRRRDVRVRQGRGSLCACRVDPRRRTAAGHADGPDRSPGGLRAADRRRRVDPHAVHHAARHRYGQHDACRRAARVRGHQPRGGDQACRPRQRRVDRHRDRRRVVS